MSQWLRFATVAGAGLLFAAEGASGAEPVAQPEAGDKAPGFSLIGSDGRTHELGASERAVVIAWFPKAFTGG